jgi:hypothetical protein
MAQGWLCRFRRRTQLGARFYPLVQPRTPPQRHRGEDQEVLAKRDALYQQARNQHPHRWSGATRNWQPIGAVTLNPEMEQQALKMTA